MRSIIALVACLACVAAFAGSDIYKWKDSQGKIHYGDKPKTGGEEAEIKGTGGNGPRLVDPDAEKAQSVLNDWLADLLWSLDWVFAVGTFEGGKRELATLAVVADAIARRLVRAGVRKDRAAAEAVMIAEIGRQSDAWERVQNAL